MLEYAYKTNIHNRHNSNTTSQKNNQEETKQMCRLGTASNEITGGGGGGLQLVCGRPTLALCSALVPQTLSCLVCVEDS